MRRLREQVKSSHTLQDILLPANFSPLLALPQDHPDIPRLRVHIAAHIHHDARPELDQLINELLVAPFAGRVDDHGGLETRERGDRSEDVGGVAGHERVAIRRERVQSRGGVGGFDGVDGELDPGDALEVRREGDGEETTAAVRVDEVGGARNRGAGGAVGAGGGREDAVADVGGERDKDGVVVLEERAGGVFEELVADAFADGASVICDAQLLLDVGCEGVDGSVCRRWEWVGTAVCGNLERLAQ